MYASGLLTKRSVGLIVLLIVLAVSIVVTIRLGDDLQFNTAKTITVPDDFLTIQAAIDNASDGDSIYVKSGVYNGNLFLNKTITLLGENLTSTVIQGQGAAAVLIMHDGVNLSGFTIYGSDLVIYGYGIHLLSAKNCRVFNNTIDHAQTGIWLYDSSYNQIFNNTITNNWSSGIYLDQSNNNTLANNRVASTEYDGIRLSNSHDNVIEENDVNNNSWSGISLNEGSSANRIFENNFISNRNPLEAGYLQTSAQNRLDDGGIGNYWSDYLGIDINGDGIGDTPYEPYLDNKDSFPLMAPFVK